jgi:hypothetical protein
MSYWDVYFMIMTASSFLVKVRNIDTDFQKAFFWGVGVGWLIGLAWFDLVRFSSVRWG